MRFATDIIGRDISFNCLECSLGAHSIMSPGGLIYENAFITVHPHTIARMMGFIVVSPKRHVHSEEELDASERVNIEEAIEFLKEKMVSLGYAEEVVVHTKQNDHLQYWIVGKYAPILENDFDISIFDTKGSMERRGLKYVYGAEILYMTQRLKHEFREKFHEITAVET